MSDVEQEGSGPSENAEAGSKPAGEREVVQTPVVQWIDRFLGLLRIFRGREERFGRVRGLLVTVGLYAVLAVGALGLLFGIVGAFQYKTFSMIWMGLGVVLAAVVVHYCAARFAGAGTRIIAEQTQRMSSGAVLDCLGLLALLGSIASVVVGLVTAIRYGEIVLLWQPLIGAVALACLALFCLNPKEVVNTEVVADRVSAGETGLAIVTFLVRCVLAAAPLLFGVGAAVCAVWMLVGMISAWAGHGPGDVFAAVCAAVCLALLPLVAYLYYLLFMMAVDFYLAVLRTARNTEHS